MRTTPSPPWPMNPDSMMVDSGFAGSDCTLAMKSSYWILDGALSAMASPLSGCSNRAKSAYNSSDRVTSIQVEMTLSTHRDTRGVSYDTPERVGALDRVEVRRRQPPNGVKTPPRAC